MPEPVIRITSTLVQVDAVVTDPKGNPVTDLTVNDFEVFQNRERRDITNFSVAVPDPEPSAKGGARPARESVRRTVVLMVDDFGVSWESFAWTRKSLIQLFEKDLSAGDLFAIVSASGGMGIYQQFTNDRKVLQEAARRLNWNARARVGLQSLASKATDAGAQTTYANDPANRPGPPANAKMDDIVNAQRQAAQAGDSQGARDLNSNSSQMAIRAVLRSLENMPGRKSMVLFSEGMPTAGTGVNAFRNGTWVRDITDAATRAAVSIYTINPTAPDYGYLAVSNGGIGNSPEDALWVLANRTGGLYLGNPADISRAVTRARDDQSSYYLLGFRPTENSFDGKFQELDVRVKRKGLTIRSRSGFVSRENTQPNPMSSGGRLRDALLSPFASSGIRTRLTAFFAVDDKREPYVQTMVFINTADLTFVRRDNGKHETSVELMLIALDEQGKQGGYVNQQYAISVDDATYADAMQRGLTYRLRLPFRKKGAVEVRTALIEKGSEKLGAASQFVQIPELKPGTPALSGILIESPDGAAKAHPLSTPAARIFRGGTRLAWHAQLVNGTANKDGKTFSATVRVLRDGRALGESNVDTKAFTKTAAADELSGEMALSERLPPGPYFLELEVMDSAKKRVTETVDFEVVAAN